MLSDFPAPELPSTSGGFSQLSGRLRPMPSSVPTPSLTLSPVKLSAFKDRSRVWSSVLAPSLASGSRLLPSHFQLSEPGCMPPAPTFGTAASEEGDDELRREMEEGTDSHILKLPQAQRGGVRWSSEAPTKGPSAFEPLDQSSSLSPPTSSQRLPAAPEARPNGSQLLPSSPSFTQAPELPSSPRSRPGSLPRWPQTAPVS